MELAVYVKQLDAGLRHSEVRRHLSILRRRAPDRVDLLPVVGTWAHHVLAESRHHIKTLLHCPQRVPARAVEALMPGLFDSAGEVLRVSPATMARVVGGTDLPGLISICSVAPARLRDLRPDRSSLILVLDGLRMIGNVGSLLRSADAAGVGAVVFTNRATRWCHPELVSASQGAALAVTFVDSTVAEVSGWLVEEGFSLYLADANRGEAVDAVRFAGRTVIVLGSEHAGISRAWYRPGAVPVTIPIGGVADSLNVAAAGAVLLFAASRQLELVG